MFAAKAPFATFMHPVHYNLRLAAAKHNSFAHAAAAARNLDAAIPLRSAETELQNTKELRATAIHKLQLQNRIPTPTQVTPKGKNDDFEALFERNF